MAIATCDDHVSAARGELSVFTRHVGDSHALATYRTELVEALHKFINRQRCLAEDDHPPAYASGLSDGKQLEVHDHLLQMERHHQMYLLKWTFMQMRPRSMWGLDAMVVGLVPLLALDRF